ncbi:1-phosphofructokinase [Salana multivorans]
MIITLTPNPSVDRAFDLDVLEVGEVNRATAVHVDAGGKGINVSRALVANGVGSLAVLPLGGSDGDLLVALLEPTGVAIRPVPLPGETRSNVTLQVAGAGTTKVNAPGPVLDAAAQAELFAAVAESAGPGDVVVGAGSLPRGTTDRFYVELGEVVRGRGARLVLDTSGPAFAAAVLAGGLALVKPNDEELGELVGRELPTVGDVVGAAREIVAAGTERVLVSLGAHGALLVTERGSCWAGGPPLVPASTVGAGDTTLAGFLAASGGALDDADDAECLRAAVAWGRAAVLLPGTAVPTPDLIDTGAVRVACDLDPTTLIKEL